MLPKCYLRLSKHVITNFKTINPFIKKNKEIYFHYVVPYFDNKIVKYLPSSVDSLTKFTSIFWEKNKTVINLCSDDPLHLFYVTGTFLFFTAALSAARIVTTWIIIGMWPANTFDIIFYHKHLRLSKKTAGFFSRHSKHFNAHVCHHGLVSRSGSGKLGIGCCCVQIVNTSEAIYHF